MIEVLQYVQCETETARMNLSNLMLEFAVLNLLYFQSPGGVRFLSAHRLAGRPGSLP